MDPYQSIESGYGRTTTQMSINKKLVSLVGEGGQLMSKAPD
jgi:hypothetical protein